MPVIKTRGTAPRKASTPARRGAAKAKPARATARRSTTRKAAPKQTERVNRSSKTDLTQAQLNKILNPLSKASKSRNRNHDAWKEDVAAVNELIVDALNEEIPVHMIVDSADVSRQHVYKIISDIEEGKRNNSGAATGKAGRPAAKRARAKNSQTRKVGRPRGKAAATKTTSTKKRVIRTRG